MHCSSDIRHHLLQASRWRGKCGGYHRPKGIFNHIHDMADQFFNESDIKQQIDYSSFTPSFSDSVHYPKELSTQNQGNSISISEESSSASTSTGDNMDDVLKPVDSFSPAQFEVFPGKAEKDATKSSDQSQQDTAFLEDSNSIPAVPEVIRGIPPAIFKFFGDTIREFDDYGRRQWFRNVEEPTCKPGTFAFCCNQGAPNPSRVLYRHPERVQMTTVEEISRRRRKCSKCTFGNWYFILDGFCFYKGNVLIGLPSGYVGDPAVLGCLFPSNSFCCSCKDRVYAYSYLLVQNYHFDRTLGEFDS